VPKNALPGDPTTWGYLAVVLSQDGFGTNRVRDVQPKAEQWRVGGGPDDTNHTRIMDVAWDGTPSQEEMLSAYRPSKEVNLDKVDTDDFAQLRMVRLVR
jgi:carbohydrate-binding DOMON domain-containing protein